MSFAHYWSYLPEAPQVRAAMARLAGDTRLIVERLRADGIGIAGPDGTGEPVVRDTQICFNGLGAQSYETFALELDMPAAYRERSHDPRFQFTWCATNLRPYDLAVRVVLLRAKQLAPDHIAIGSNATWPEWQDARDLVAELFEPYDGPDPLDGTCADGPPILLRTPQATLHSKEKSMGTYLPPPGEHEALVRAVLRSISADHYSDEGAHADAESWYSHELVALAARKLVQAVQALAPQDRPLGWDPPAVSPDRR